MRRLVRRSKTIQPHRKVTQLIKKRKSQGSDQNYKLYLDYRNSLDQLDTNQSNLWDTHLLAVSGSSLAFSTVFIDKVVPLATAGHHLLLYLSWLLLLVATLSTLFSFQAAKQTASSYLKQWEDCYGQPEFPPQLKSKWETCTTILNTLSITSFIIGILSLAFFVALNLNLENSPCPTLLA